MGCLAPQAQQPQSGVSWFDSDGCTFRYYADGSLLMFEEDEKQARPIARGEIDWNMVPQQKHLELKRVLERLGPEKVIEVKQQRDAGQATTKTNPTVGKSDEAMDCKFLEACGFGENTLTPEELKRMCESMECKNIGDIGKAAEAMAEKLGGFEPVLGKLQKDVGDATWQNILKEYQKYKGEGAPTAGGKGAGTIVCKFLEACGSGDSTLTPEEMQKMCQSMECENISDIGKAAETMAEKLGGFEPVLGKLQKDVGDATWQNISKEYKKYLGEGAPAAGGTGAGAMDCKFLEACGSGDSTLTPEELEKMCQSMECENIGDIGKAAETMAKKLGGFEPVLGKLQNDVGDETWQKILKEYEKYSGEGAPAADGKGEGAMDCKFLEACGSGDSTLTAEELEKMCQSMECENISDIGKAAEAMTEKLGGFEPVLGKLQNDVGDETWQKILKEYEKYSGEDAPAAPAASKRNLWSRISQRAPAPTEETEMDCKFLEACSSGDSTLTPEEIEKMCRSMECENISDIGKAAEAMAEKFGGYVPVFGKLEDDVGDETWQKILKEYEKYTANDKDAAGDEVMA